MAVQREACHLLEDQSSMRAPCASERSFNLSELPRDNKALANEIPTQGLLLHFVVERRAR